MKATDAAVARRLHLPPPWVVALVRDECERWLVPAPPLVVWKKHRACHRANRRLVPGGLETHSHGTTTYGQRIKIYAGRDRRDQKLVVLHALYVRHRLGRYGLKREQSYKIAAIHAAADAGVISHREAKRINKERTASYRRPPPIRFRVITIRGEEAEADFG